MAHQKQTTVIVSEPKVISTNPDGVNPVGYRPQDMKVKSKPDITKGKNRPKK